MRKKISVPTLYPLNRDLAKTWFVKFYTPAGKLVKMYGQLAWYHTVKEKEAEGARIIAEILNPHTAPVEKRRDIIGLLSELLEYKKPGLEEKTYQSYFSILKGFAVWYRAAATHNKQVQPGEYIRHMQVKGFHKNTIRNRMIVLKGLAAEKKITPNPFDGIKLKKVKGTSKLPFTDNQLTEIKQALATDLQIWLAVQFMYYLYMRPKELRLLKIGDILFTDNKIVLPGSIVKDDDTIMKAIPLPLQGAIAALRANPAHYYVFSKGGKPGTSPLGKNNLTRRVSAVLRGLNFSDRYTFYSFCHTGIKNAALSGIPLKQLQLQKGHADLKMFDEYMKNLGIDDCTQLVNNFPAM